MKLLRPLTQDMPDKVWLPHARKLGISVATLRAQIALADSIMDEIIAEDNFRLKSRQWFKRPIE